MAHSTPVPERQPPIAPACRLLRWGTWRALVRLHRPTRKGRQFRLPADLLLACLLVTLGLALPTMQGAFAFFSAATGNPNDTFSSAPGFAPTNLTPATACPNVQLTWTAPAGGWAARYNLYRSASSGGEDLAGPLAAGVTATSYSDTSGLVSGAPYYYEVQAISSGAAAGPATMSTEQSLLYDCTLQVTGVAPANGQTNVSTSARVAVIFNDAMKTAPPANSMTLQPCTTSACTTLGAAIGASLAVNGSTVTLTPSSSLSATTWYLVTAATSLAGSGGQALAANYSAKFETGASGGSTPPIVVPPTSPAGGANNAPANAAVTVTFSNTMNQAATQGAFSLKQTTGTACYVSGGAPLCATNGGSFAWSGASQNIMTFTPSQNWIQGGGYSVTISTAAADIFGVNMTTAYTFTFNTVPPDTTAPNRPAVTAPTGVVWVPGTSYPIQGTVSSSMAESTYTVRVFNDNVNCATYGSGNGVGGLTLAASETLTGSLTTFSIATPLAAGSANCFLVTSTDDAGNVSTTTAVPMIHQGNTQTTIGTLTLTPSFNTVVVSIGYSDDANKNNSATMAYCTGANCTNFGAAQGMSGGGASGSPFTGTISGLARDTTYTVQVAVGDLDGISGANPVSNSATTVGFLSGGAGAGEAFASRAPASGIVTISGPNYESADVTIQTNPVKDLGCQTLSAGGTAFPWTGIDGSAAFQQDGNYIFVATNHFGAGCTGVNLGSAAGTVKISNASSITLAPPPASVTLFPGQSVTIMATLNNSVNAGIPDGTPFTWSAVGSVTGNVNGDLSAGTGTVGGGSGGCVVPANAGQACVVLTLPVGARTIQTITVTASMLSQTYDTSSAATVIGQTTINDPPAPPSNLQLSLGSIILHWAPSADGRAAGYKIFVGRQSHQYGVVVDVGDVTAYEYHDVVPGTTYYVTVRAYNAVGVLSDSATEGRLTIPMPTVTPTVTPTQTATPPPTATAMPTATATVTASPIPTLAPTATAGATATSGPTRTPAAAATATAVATGCVPRVTATTIASPTATSTPTGLITPTATTTAQPECTATPTATVTVMPTVTAAPTATVTPTLTPAGMPTATVTVAPPATVTVAPSPTPSAAPTVAPTITASPTLTATPMATTTSRPTATADATATAPATASRQR